MFAVPLAVALALTPAPAALVAAPADVAVAWTSAAHDDVVVTWTESGDFRDRVEVVHADGSPIGGFAQFVAAGQPDRSPLPGRNHDGPCRVVVTAVDDAGNPISEPGSSPAFDMYLPPQPVLTAVVPRADGTVRMTWKPGAATADDTPGDPLDYDAPVRFIPVATSATFTGFGPMAPASDATSFTVPADRRYPTHVGVQTEPTFWGWTAAWVEVNGTRITVSSIPGTAKPGTRIAVHGTALRLRRVCDPGPCWAENQPDADRVLTLQARPHGGGKWTAVGTTKATSDGGFEVAATFTGTRDYRVVAAPVGYPARETAGVFGASDVSTIRALPSTAPAGSGGAGGSVSPGIPITGTAAATTAATGAGLIVLGVVLAAAGRPRRRSRG